MQFVPSRHSYGQTDLSTSPVPAPAPTSATAQIKEYAELGIGLVKSALPTDAATIRAEIEIAKQKVRSGAPGPLGFLQPNYWQNRLLKLQHQLPVAEAEAQSRQMRDIGYTVAIFAGIVVIGGIALNQFQTARRQQVEIRKLQAGV